MSNYNGLAAKRRRSEENSRNTRGRFNNNRGKGDEEPLPPNRVLHMAIEDARYPITVDVIHTISSPHGKVEKIVIFQRNGVFALVEFDSIDSATKAMQGLDGADIYSGCCTLKIVYAKPKVLNVKKNDTESWDYTVSGSGAKLESRPPLLDQPPAGYGATSLDRRGPAERGGFPQERVDRARFPLERNERLERGGGVAVDSLDRAGFASNRLDRAGFQGDRMGREEGFQQERRGFTERLGWERAGDYLTDRRDLGRTTSSGLMEDRLDRGGYSQDRLDRGRPLDRFDDYGTGYDRISTDRLRYLEYERLLERFPGRSRLSPGYLDDLDQEGHEEEGAVIMVYELNQEKFNCDRLFNMFCLYGNVAKVKFLMKKDGTAMVQMGDKEGMENAMEFLNKLSIFGNTIQLAYSKQPTLKDVPQPQDLSDGTPSFKDYQRCRNNRFSNPQAAKKNRIQSPSKVLHFYNGPPGISEEELNKIFADKNVDTPLAVKIFEGKSDRSSSGLMEFENVNSALEALVVANNFAIGKPNDKFPHIFKLCFSSGTL